MPIYEYRCEPCDHEFEALIRGGEVAHCPKCDSIDVAKRFSVPAAAQAGGGRPNPLPVCGPMPATTGGCGMGGCGSGMCGLE
jgi:putative FmdB family regulatory protein